MFPESDQDGSFGKMCQAHSVPTKAKISESSSKKSVASSIRPPMFLDLRQTMVGVLRGASWEMDGLSLGEYTMHSFGEFPNEERESHLSQILEAKVSPKYYLSATACKGILRRATERGKELPEILRMVLERQSLSKTDADVMGGAKECLSKRTESEHCQPSITKPSFSSGGGQRVMDLFSIEGNGKRNGHNGAGYTEEDVSYTLNSVEQHAIAYRKQGHPQSAEEGQGWEEEKGERDAPA